MGGKVRRSLTFQSRIIAQGTLLLILPVVVIAAVSTFTGKAGGQHEALKQLTCQREALKLHLNSQAILSQTMAAQAAFLKNPDQIKSSLKSISTLNSDSSSALAIIKPNQKPDILANSLGNALDSLLEDASAIKTDVLRVTADSDRSPVAYRIAQMGSNGALFFAGALPVQLLDGLVLFSNKGELLFKSSGLPENAVSLLSEAGFNGSGSGQGQAEEWNAAWMPLAGGEYQAAYMTVQAAGENLSMPLVWAGLAGLILAAGLWFLLVKHSLGGFNQAQAGLNNVYKNLSGVIQEIGNSSQELAAGASQQAAAMEEISSALEEISSQAKQNADKSDAATGLVQDTAKQIEAAGTSMWELKQAMDRVTKGSDETADIVKGINEIAFQTSLLSLNAAVEAARAGEAGAGFSVVAEEVGRLASRASDAAKRTEELIQENTKHIKKSTELLKETDEGMYAVEEIANKLGVLVSEISEASKEQALGVVQAGQAVNEVDAVTQKTAASAEEAAAVSTEMTGQVDAMHNYLAQLAADDENAEKTVQYDTVVNKRIGKAKSLPKLR